MKRLWLIVPLVVGAIVFFIYRGLMARVDEQSAEIADDAADRLASVERQLPKFFADRARVMAEPLFAPPRRSENDAARMMWRFVPWRPASRPSATYDHAMVRFRESFPDYRAPEPLAPPLRDPPAEWERDLEARARRLPKTTLDHFKWLDDFQFWDIELESPRAYFATEDPFELGFSQPEPQFSELVFWGRLLLVHGAQTGRLPEAIARVKRLARLLLTTENLIGQHDAIVLLADAERFARRQRVAPPIDPETLSAATRYYEGLRGLLVPQLGDARLRRIFDASAPGVCAAFADSMPFLQTVRFGLERRAKPFYEWLDAVASSEVCSSALWNLRRVWRPVGERALLERWNDIQSRDQGWDDEIYFQIGVRVPGIQANVGEAMVLHALDHFDKAYPDDQ